MLLLEPSPRPVPSPLFCHMACADLEDCVVADSIMPVFSVSAAFYSAIALALVLRPIVV